MAQVLQRAAGALCVMAGLGLSTLGARAAEVDDDLLRADVAVETVAANLPPQVVLTHDLKNTARLAAIADSVSTLTAISAGAAELNPLVSPTPAGLLALVGIKLGLLEYTDRLAPDQRRQALRAYSTLWTGVSASNLLVAVSVAPPLAAVVGVATGVWMWVRSSPTANPTEPATHVALQAQ